MIILKRRRYVQYFLLNSGDSSNGRPNDNGPNAKLESLYNRGEKAKWHLRFATIQFIPAHVNSILVDSWEEFKL